MSKLQQIVAIAKQDKLRFPNRHAKWTDYIKAASKKVNSSGDRTALKSSVGKVKKTQTGTSNKKIDKRIQAKPVGKRKAASKTAKKPFYYEYRANRTDKGKLLGIEPQNKLQSEVAKLFTENAKRIANIEKTIANHSLAIKKPSNKIYLVQLKKQQIYNKKLLKEIKVHQSELKKLL